MRIPKFSLLDLRCSLLLVEPKAKFISWLSSFLGHDDVQDIYFREENAAILIPPISGFDSEVDFWSFIDERKESFLKAELVRFLKNMDDFPYEINKTTFDDFFSIEIRDTLILLDEIAPE
jgi:hypothetical protein